jgi:hypothetical protein
MAVTKQQLEPILQQHRDLLCLHCRRAAEDLAQIEQLLQVGDCVEAQIVLQSIPNRMAYLADQTLKLAETLQRYEHAPDDPAYDD